MENNNKKGKRTVLSSMEEIVSLAKKYSLEPEFYEKGAAALKHISKALNLTKDEAMLLSFFIELSCRSRIWVSGIAEMINVSNIRLITMLNVADGLIEKGFVTSHASGKDERYYSVPAKASGRIFR